MINTMANEAFRAVLLFSALLLTAATLHAQASEQKRDGANLKSTNPDATTATARDADAGPQHRVSPEVAEDRAKLMHKIYAATLDVMHDRYFHGDRAIVPARAMEDVFSEMQRQSEVQARWIAVNLKPMSLDHEAESDFEKRAKKEIAGGKKEVDVVEGGFYRRAEAIPLTSNCISCHAGLFRTAPKKPRFAALVISIPVRED